MFLLYPEHKGNYLQLDLLETMKVSVEQVLQGKIFPSQICLVSSEDFEYTSHTDDFVFVHSVEIQLKK